MFDTSSTFSTLLLLAAQSADLQFHDWCSTVGIASPLARLETTSRSVAGRGVFATENMQEGDIAITIPEDVVLHEYNAAAFFPDLAQELWKHKVAFEEEHKERRAHQQGVGGRQRWWHRLFKRHRQQPDTFEFTDSSDLWQATLTSFSLACLEEPKNNPWNYWISQWQRNDPMQSLFEQGISWRDEQQILACVDQLSAMLPEVSKTKLRAAVEMRLGRLEDLKNIFDLEKNDDEYNKKVSTMYGILTSRAIELGDGVLGVLPLFDMLNHSNDPNLALSFDGEQFSLWAVRDIGKGEELFVCYKDRRAEPLEWDEDNAVWMLVQWGIPLPKPGKVKTTASIGMNKDKTKEIPLTR